MAHYLPMFSLGRRAGKSAASSAGRRRSVIVDRGGKNEVAILRETIERRSDSELSEEPGACKEMLQLHRWHCQPEAMIGHIERVAARCAVVKARRSYVR